MKKVFETNKNKYTQDSIVPNSNLTLKSNDFKRNIFETNPLGVSIDNFFPGFRPFPIDWQKKSETSRIRTTVIVPNSNVFLN